MDEQNGVKLNIKKGFFISIQAVTQMNSGNMWKKIVFKKMPHLALSIYIKCPEQENPDS